MTLCFVMTQLHATDISYCTMQLSGCQQDFWRIFGFSCENKRLSVPTTIYGTDTIYYPPKQHRTYYR